jgi:hypothetical protein
MQTQFWLENFKGISHFGSADVMWEENTNINHTERDPDGTVWNKFSQDWVL